MTFQLTNFRARSWNYQGVTRKYGTQELQFGITAANTDVTLDLATIASTFWTAAIADATYGTLATQALADLQLIAGVSTHLFATEAEELLPYVKVLALTSGNQYTLAVGTASATVIGHMPQFVFNSGSAPTALTLLVRLHLLDGQFPSNYTLG